MLQTPHNFETQANILFDLVSPMRMQGLIIWSGSLNAYLSQEEMTAFCQRYAPLPLVSVETVIPGIPSLLTDDYQGMRQIMTHLIEAHGYRRIAFIRGPITHLGAQERYRAYTDTLTAYGLPLDPALITPPADFIAGAEMTRFLLDDRQVDFEAIVGAADIQANEALSILQSRGWQIPQNAAVAGFDNILASRVSTPPLTTIQPSFYQLGYRAIELVLAQLAGQPVAPVEYQPVQMIVRQSCGCNASSTLRLNSRPVTPAIESLDTLLSLQRQQILADMGQMQTVEPLAELASQIHPWVEQLLDSFIGEITGQASNIFLPTLEKVLQQTAAAEGRLTIWQQTVSVLRHYLQPHLKGQTLAQAETLWQQAQITIGDIAERTALYRAFQTEKQTQTLHQMNDILLSIVELNTLTEILTQHLPRLGFPGWYLSLYEEGPISSKIARLIVAYHHGPIEVELGGQTFPAEQLIPPQLLGKENLYSLVVEPLYFRETQLGFIVLEAGPRDGLVYEALRGQLSNTLYGNWLLQKHQQTEEALRQQAIEQEIHRREHRRQIMLERVVQVGKAVTQAADLRTCLLNIHNNAQELGFDRVGVFLYDASTQIVQGTFGTDLTGQLIQEEHLTILMEPDNPQYKLLTDPHGYILSDDYANDYQISADNPRMAGVKQNANVAMWAGNRPVGLISVDNLLTQRPFKTEQIEALQLFAGYAGLAIENARLLEQVRRTEQTYYAIFENSMEGIFQVSPEGSLLSANPALARILGYTSPEEMIATVVNLFTEICVEPNRRHEMLQLLQTQGQLHLFEFEARRRDGQLIWLAQNTRVVYNHPNAKRYYEGTLIDITERKQAEIALNREHGLLQALMNHLPDQIYVKDTDSRFLRINPAQARFFGAATVAEVIGKTDFDFQAPQLAELFYTEEQHLVASGEPIIDRFEFNPTADGHPRWLSATKVPLKDNTGKVIGLVGISHNITEQKKVEEELRQYRDDLEELVKARTAELQQANTQLQREITERQQIEADLAEERNMLRTVIDAVPDFIYVKDSVGRFVLANIGVTRGVGLGTPEELVGKGDFDISPPELAAQYFADEEAVMKSGQALVDREEMNIDPQGRIRWFSSTKVPLRDSQGVIIGTVGTSRDITERKLMEETLRQAKALAEERSLAAETANRAKSTFLANMSHELRTPLNGILGYTQILQRDRTLSPRQAEAIDIIRRSGEHLLAMINDVLDISKIEADKLALITVEFHLLDFLRPIVEMMRTRAEQKGLTFSYQPQPPLPAGICTDEVRLRQVLLNLLSNAIKFTAQGRIIFRVEMLSTPKPGLSEIHPEKEGRVKTAPLLITHHPLPRTVSQTAAAPLSNVVLRFTIEDTGIGIPPEQQIEIFLPFHQVGDKRIQAAGTGLGLAISQKLVQMMGGRGLQVNSVLGQGSAFWFEITLPEVSGFIETQPQEQPQIIGYYAHPKATKKQFTILLADDRLENRRLLQDILNPLGFTLVEAGTGQGALTLVASNQPDLILMDLIMPDMNGLEAAQQIRRQPAFKNTKIIAISASATLDARQECLAAGCDDFIAKPFAIEALLAKIAQYLPLDWIFESTPNKQTQSVSTLDSLKGLTGLPRSELMALLELTRLGDLYSLQTQLEQLKTEFPPFVAAATHLEQLARQFKLTEIENLLNGVWDEKEVLR